MEQIPFDKAVSVFSPIDAGRPARGFRADRSNDQDSFDRHLNRAHETPRAEPADRAPTSTAPDDEPQRPAEPQPKNRSEQTESSSPPDKADVQGESDEQESGEDATAVPAADETSKPVTEETEDDAQPEDELTLDGEQGVAVDVDEIAVVTETEAETDDGQTAEQADGAEQEGQPGEKRRQTLVSDKAVDAARPAKESTPASSADAGKTDAGKTAGENQVAIDKPSVEASATVAENPNNDKPSVEASAAIAEKQTKGTAKSAETVKQTEAAAPVESNAVETTDEAEPAPTELAAPAKPVRQPKDAEPSSVADADDLSSKPVHVSNGDDKVAKTNKRRAPADDRARVHETALAEAASAQRPRGAAGFAPAADPSTEALNKSATETNRESSDPAPDPAAAKTDAAASAPAATKTGRNGLGFAGRLTAQAPKPEGPSEAHRVRFVQRVARAFEAISERGGPLRLRLSPPELGSLRLEVAIREGAMTARIEAETPSARQMLLDNLPNLRERLAAHDIKIERFDVDLMDQSPDGAGRPLDRESESTGRDENRRDGRHSPSGESDTTPESGSTRTRPRGPEQLDVVI